MFPRGAFFFWVLCCLAVPVPAESTLQLKPVLSGLSQPLFATHAGDGSRRLFIVTKGGRIWVRQPGSSETAEFLDLSSRVTNASEMGLLGLAFHPSYSDNGRLFVDYATEVDGPRRSIIAEYRVVAGDPNRADPQSERILLSFNQPAANHNGGMLAFGPDGYLYISTGDGGGAGDTYGNGQDPSTLLGAILRIDVDSGEPFSIPAGNPFVASTVARPEIWAYGLRNPWRFSFDRLTGQLYAGDVGQNRWEEIDLIAAGRNYGWNVMEGDHCYPDGSACDPSAFTGPIAEYSHAEGSSVTGGYAYRGTQETTLWGSYLFGDYGSGRIWSLRALPGGGWHSSLLLDTDASIASFGEDEEGELYLVDFRGTVSRLDFGESRIVPQLGDGSVPEGRLQTRLILVNPGGREVLGTLQIHDQSGTGRLLSLNGVSDTSFPIRIAPYASVLLESTGLSEPAWVGWASIKADGPFQGVALYRFEPTVGPVSEAGVDLVDTGSDFSTFAERVAASGIETGFALANASGRTARITVTLSAASLPSRQVNLALDPGEQRAAFLSELFNGLPETLAGTARVTSDADIAVTVLRTERGRPLSSLPLARGPRAWE